MSLLSFPYFVWTPVLTPFHSQRNLEVQERVRATRSRTVKIEVVECHVVSEIWFLLHLQWEGFADCMRPGVGFRQINAKILQMFEIALPLYYV